MFLLKYIIISEVVSFFYKTECIVHYFRWHSIFWLKNLDARIWRFFLCILTEPSFANNSSNVRSWKCSCTNWKALRWILFSLCSIFLLWSIQIRGQYESCDVIKAFVRVLRFLASIEIQILAKAWSFLLTFSQNWLTC